ncbi:MAG: hypothetical protein ACP5GF_12255 [Thiomonas sp.]
MAFKSIIDIDVNDEKFQGFLRSFDEFVAKTEDIPEPFKELTKRIGHTRAEVAKLGSDLEKRMKAAGKSTHSVASGFEHIDKAVKKLPGGIHRASNAFKAFGHEAKKVGHVLKGVAAFALKLTPLGMALGALGGVGSLLGLGAMANDAMTRERNAKALGMRPGSVAAIESVLRPVLPNASGSLSAFSAAYTTPTGVAALDRAFQGTSWQGESKSRAFMQALARAQRVAKRTPTELLGIMDQARGFSQIGISTQELRLLKHTSRASLEAWERESLADRQKLAFSRATARDWAKLDVQLREAGVQIGTVLIKDLSALGPSIARLTKTIVDDLSSHQVQQAIKGFAHWVSSGADALEKWLKSPAFNADLKSMETGFDKIVQKLPMFVTALTDAAQDIIAVTKWFHGGSTGEHSNKGFKTPKDNPENWKVVNTKNLHTPWGTVHLPFAVKQSRYMGPDYYKTNPSNPANLRAEAEKIAKAKGLYLNPANWRKYNNPGDIDPSIVVDGHTFNAYRKFKSLGAAYRNMAATVRGYGRHTLAGILTTYEGQKPSAGLMQAASQASGFAPNQKLNLSDPQVMAHVLAGIDVTEQKHKRSPQELYEVIYRAITDGMRHAQVHVHVGKPGPASNIGMQIHGAAR